jgi:AraC-like DNA-binding protein
MLLVSRRPGSAPLAQFVESLHFHAGDPVPFGLERILPGGQIHIMVNMEEDQFRTYSGPDCSTVSRTRGAILQGPASKPAMIDTVEQRSLVTVNFKPGGAAPFFKVPISETCEQLVDLDQLWGCDGAILRERLLEARTPESKLNAVESALSEQLEYAGNPDRAIPWAASALERGLPVSEVTSRLGLLPKTFVRRFGEQMGLSPKRFSRVRRLQRLLRSVERPDQADWAELAALHGYYDQAHLIHDFHDLTGMTPSAYRPDSYEGRNHVPVGKT